MSDDLIVLKNVFLVTFGAALDDGSSKKVTWLLEQKGPSKYERMRVDPDGGVTPYKRGIIHLVMVQPENVIKKEQVYQSKMYGDLYLEGGRPVNRIAQIAERLASRIMDFPHRTQSFAYDCGATAVLVVLQFYGFDTDRINEQGVMDAIGTDVNGTDNEGIEVGLLKLGMNFDKVRTLEEMDKHLDAGRPVIVSVAQWVENGAPVWHYEAVFARENDHYIVSDPWALNLVWATRDVFDKIWYEPKDVSVRRWGIAVYGEPKYHEIIAPMDYKLASKK